LRILTLSLLIVLRSDVLGHILPIVGQDWAQSGVAQLFTKIKNNGYRILYLSARAIGQAHITREYLRSVKQGDLSLPDGPLLLNPTSLLSAFHRYRQNFILLCFFLTSKTFSHIYYGKSFFL
jgi:phosphatidate phosphatase PAH1